MDISNPKRNREMFRKFPIIFVVYTFTTFGILSSIVAHYYVLTNHYLSVTGRTRQISVLPETCGFADCLHAIDWKIYENYIISSSAVTPHFPTEYGLTNYSRPTEAPN